MLEGPSPSAAGITLLKFLSRVKFLIEIVSGKEEFREMSFKGVRRGREPSFPVFLRGLGVRVEVYEQVGASQEGSDGRESAWGISKGLKSLR